MTINNLPSGLQAAIQQGYLERDFEEALRAKLGFRAIADREPFMAGIGETITKTRPGLLPTITSALSPAANTDLTSGLTPQDLSVEQYTLSVSQYAANAMLNLATSQVAIASVFLQNVQKLGEQAARSIDVLAQQALYSAYLSGNAVVTATTATSAVVTVDNTNGFTAGDVVTVNGNAYTIASVQAGTSLTMTATVANGDNTKGNYVVDATGSTMFRSAMGTGSTLKIANILSAKAQLEANNVPKLDDGFYVFYADPFQVAGLYQDPVFQQFFRGQIDTKEYKRGVIAELMGVKIVETNLNPVVTLAGVSNVRRGIIAGKGALVEGVFTNTAYAAANAQDDGNLTTVVDGIAHVTREQIDALKQVITQSWSYIGGFVAPTDTLTNSGTIPTASNARYKRAVIVESL